MANHPVKTIIHGHFYQPPREDPWTDQVFEQPSAYPAHDWNERISSECYAPNCYSRVLDHEGRIKKIINNYKHISFNFGPTLLLWLEKHQPLVYQHILEADSDSIEMHNGHGNAIAQVYNHVILPLQSFEDKKTQIIWGLKDFENRFGRESEGIWLSETACDYKTIDLLIEFGIKYLILSPLQAEAFRKSGRDKWIETREHAINTTRPYKIVRNHGEIAVFYYDKGLSTAVSFEHLLKNADSFAGRIIGHPQITSPEDLVCIATDGEIYGHHEPFGDMCLSSMISRYQDQQNRIKFMNFGEYLSEHPPEYETRISLGDDGLGSSWSCFHGVGRWYRNCGCHTGGQDGWNQEWRKPLREAFNSIKIRADEQFLEVLSDYFDDPWSVRNDYIEYILGGYNPNNLQFLSRHAKKSLDKPEIQKILSMLEMQKYAMFMFTSCAWFFTELSGIETVQNMKYAHKVLSLLPERADETKAVFEEFMEQAHSNLHQFQNGKWIMDNWVYPSMNDAARIAANMFTLNAVCDSIDKSRFDLFSTFDFRNVNIERVESNYTIYRGELELVNKKNYTGSVFHCIFAESSDHRYICYVCADNVNDSLDSICEPIIKDPFNEFFRKEIRVTVVTEKDLLDEVKHFIISCHFASKIDEITESNMQQLDSIKPLLSYYQTLSIQPPPIIKTYIRIAAESYFHQLTESLKDFPQKKTYQAMLKLFQYVVDFNVQADTRRLEKCLSRILEEKLTNLGENDIFSEVFTNAIILIQFSNKAEIKIEKSVSENLIYSLLKTNAPLLVDQLNNTENEEEKSSVMLELRRLIQLADTFNINTESEKKNFFSRMNTKSGF
jgi:alpha-amylase/alpha-mannosidase (GH57 family)